MEAFSLLKYWRGGGGGGGGGGGLPPPSSAADTTTTAILTAVAQNDTETDDDNDSNGDDGPFFDLEFTVPDEPDDSEDAHENPNDNHSAHHSEEEEEEENDDVVDNNEESESEGEREFKFTLSPSTSNDRSDPNLSVSDDLFFKGKLVHLDLNSSEPNSKPQSSLLKSATKFRVFMLGLKKSKSNIASSSHKHKESNASDSVAPNPKKQPQQQRKLFTVKFKVEEVPIMSLFTRDNKASQNKKHNTEEETQSPSSSASDEKLLHKYLKMVKPLYIRVSRRYAEKLRFSGQLNITSSSKAPAPPPPPPPPEKEKEKEKAQTETDASETANVKGQKQGNLALPAGLRVVCKHLGKSRSASSAPPAVASAPAPAQLASSRRRDDSLLQQQDGIQGAIMHCKRSFNASRGCESSQLPRSVSEPLHEISPELSRKSTNESKNKRL